MKRVGAVLFDRDGTLVEDVPYNGDPDRVRPVPGARRALDLVRRAGLRTGVVSNQSGIGRGLLTHAQVRRVNERADLLLGGLGTWVYCPHAPAARCTCRKPRPGLVIEAARRLGVPPGDCVVIGDIAADVLAARAAGAGAVLVPTAATRPEEIDAAPRTAPDLLTAVRMILAGCAGCAGCAGGAGGAGRSGPTGPTGDACPTGPTGDAGPTGPTGDAEDAGHTARASDAGGEQP
ncbi:D-glycero-alpha-D-manno-heptose-1,7-bisphosphate 7-phosphatase [Streptomyces sp. DSM 15324]|uniref:D-glycero-alpha-D-manno-heptose-1,7-bisphosphate 7-phosphatase n=1 Tax=Streptomyces sp. DSM 15324 TaxID=1739111 RepID=UPI00099E2C40|nr:HAD family hydrolase [Streptomyces sp. DSM 15324]